METFLEMISNAEPWCFIYFPPNPAADQTVQLPVILDADVRQYNELDPVTFWCDFGVIELHLTEISEASNTNFL